MAIKLPNPKYIPTPCEQMQYPGQRVQIDVKYVPAPYLVGAKENGGFYYQYTFVDEFSRFRYFEAFKEHNSYFSVVSKFKVKLVAKKVEDSVEETPTYTSFPFEHWTRIRTNNVIERLNREIRRRARVVGCFPDGNSALMLVCARLRHIAGTHWRNKKYINMKHLETALDDAPIVG